MKRVLLVLFLHICSAFTLSAQENPDAILGKWMKVPKKDLVIEVFKSEGEYKGKITWTKDNSGKKPVGFVIIEKLQYNAGKDMWENGTIHDPSSGSTYSATAKIDTSGNLEVFGYKGIKLLGSTKYFEKVE